MGQVMSKPSHALIGISGVHYVVSELSRRGLVALPTVRNTAGYDIIVSNAEGTKYANIQVKTSLKRVSFFPMPPSEKINDHKTAYYALVRWLPRESRFECFFLSGKEAREEVRAGEKFQRRKIREGSRQKLFPSIYVSAKAGDKPNTWRSRWAEWGL